MKSKKEVIFLKSQKSPAPAERSEEAAGIIAALDDFALLVRVYRENFLIGGIADKIANTAASGWIFPDETPKNTREILENLDLEALFLSYFVTGNVFLEKVRDGFGSVVELVPFLTEKMHIRIENGRKQYVYQNGSKSDIFEEDDVVHIKNISLKSRHYGESKIAKCADQIALLTFIDQYYSRVFESGFFSNKILTDNKGHLNDEQKSALRNFLDERAKGVKNAFSLLILPSEFGVLNLDDINNIESFLRYREDLIHSIAITLNIPVDVILPQKASRATKTASLSELNTDIIWPMQQRILSQLKKSLKSELEGMENIDILAIDTKNQVDEMRIATGLVAGGIITPNEAREMLGREKIPNADALFSPQTPKNFGENEEIAKIEKSLHEMYQNFYE